MDYERIRWISDRIARGSLIVFLFVIVIPHTAALQSILFVLSILCTIIQGLISREFPIRRTPLDIPILILSLIIIAKCIFSVDVNYSMGALKGEYFKQVITYYLITTHLVSPRYTQRLLITLMLAVGCISLIGLPGYFYGGMVADGRATSFINNFGKAAFLTSMIMPLILGRFLCSRKLHRSLALGLLLLLCLAFMIVTMSRGAWISSLLAVSILAALKDKRMLILLIIGVMSTPWFLPPDIINRASTVTRILDLSEKEAFGDRMWLWRSSLDMIQDRPILGAGYGNRIYQRLYPYYIYSHSSGVIFENAHNLYLQVAVETGLAGLLALLGFLGNVVVLILLMLRKKPEPNTEGQLLGLAGAFTVFFIFSMTTFRYENEIGIIVWTLAAVVSCLWMNSHNPEPAEGLI